MHQWEAYCAFSLTVTDSYEEYFSGLLYVQQKTKPPTEWDLEEANYI